MLVVQVASRRNLLRIVLIPGLIIVPLVFWGYSRGHDIVFFSQDVNIPGIHTISITMLGIGILLAGFFTVAQFSFWGNYLPHAYPMHVRGTGESFAANIGGRMMGTPFGALTQWLAVLPFFAPQSAPANTAIVAAGVALALYLLNLLLVFILPEPPRDLLPD
jgi:hypothetical protein